MSACSAGSASVWCGPRSSRRAARGRPTHPGHDPDEAADPAGSLRALAADPLVREAVSVAGSALSEVVRRVLDGAADVGPVRLRRSVEALAAARLRMSTRPTSCGLMAGSHRCGAPPTGRRRRCTGRRPPPRGPPGPGWLATVVADWERRPGVLRHLRVVVNALCTDRGGRLVLPYAPQPAPADGPEGAIADDAGDQRTVRR
ncbi:lantibiotic dehydratase [Streptomyces albulus]|nr:lantibiotic dehydratase [Streptomyces noursei]